jgi:hypothetical protein
MAKFPVKVGSSEVVIQEYGDGEEHIVKIDDRFYRVHHTGDVHYFMTKIRGTQRSVSGSPEKVREAVVKVHLAHKSYEKLVQRRKEEAQRIRDRDLNEIVESLNDPMVPKEA